MPPKPDPDMVTTTIRLPRTLLERIDQLAAEERRSRNATITIILERGVER